MMMVRKAGSASAVCSHFMRTTLSIISAPTVISAGPIAYGGTLAARAPRPSACWFLNETRVWMKDWAPGIAPGQNWNAVLGLSFHTLSEHRIGLPQWYAGNSLLCYHHWRF